METYLDQEPACEFVSSRGILKSCNVHSATPRSSVRAMGGYSVDSIRAMKPGDAIYVCSSAVPEFIRTAFPLISVPFILVSGDCDETTPYEILPDQQRFTAFIESPLLIKWCAQNCVLLGKYPKLTQIPIGLDYHTLAASGGDWGPQASPREQEAEMNRIRGAAPPFWGRSLSAYANFQFRMNTKFAQDRVLAMSQIPRELVFYEPAMTDRCAAWTNQSQRAFVVSPHGNGLDCHRTWEAMCLGCIPIVKCSPLDPLFAELPVLIVRRWSDVSAELLQSTATSFREKHERGEFLYDKLTIKYWMKCIRDTNQSYV